MVEIVGTAAITAVLLVLPRFDLVKSARPLSAKIVEGWKIFATSAYN